MERPVLIAGDDGVPVRVREELAGLGIPTVSICSHKRVRAARAAAEAGARVVIGEVTQPATWHEAGIEHARSVGVLGPDDLENLNTALLVADETQTIPIVVRLFSLDLATGVEQMLGGRGTVLSEIEVAGPALIQAALEGNEGQRVTAAGRILEVDEVDRDDPAIVVTLCDVEHPTHVFPPREQIGAHVLALVDRQQVVTGARGSLPASVARFHQPQPQSRRAPLERPPAGDGQRHPETRVVAAGDDHRRVQHRDDDVRRLQAPGRHRQHVLHGDDDGHRRLRRRQPPRSARLAEAVRHRADGGVRGAAGVRPRVRHRPARQPADRPRARPLRRGRAGTT